MILRIIFPKCQHLEQSLWYSFVSITTCYCCKVDGGVSSADFRKYAELSATQIESTKNNIPDILNNKTGSVLVTLRGVHLTIVAVEKTLIITYYECVFVSLGIQYAKRIRRIVLEFV